jgi:hypothetical protein
LMNFHHQIFRSKATYKFIWQFSFGLWYFKAIWGHNYKHKFDQISYYMYVKKAWTVLSNRPQVRWNYVGEEQDGGGHGWGEGNPPRPGAYPTKSYKYLVTYLLILHICNFLSTLFGRTHFSSSFLANLLNITCKID